MGRYRIWGCRVAISSSCLPDLGLKIKVLIYPSLCSRVGHSAAIAAPELWLGVYFPALGQDEGRAYSPCSLDAS
jgi:hypothetical protein